MGRLDGKVAIITGASRGQGEAEARRFVQEGASVLLTDVLDEEDCLDVGLTHARRGRTRGCLWTLSRIPAPRV